MSQSREGTTEAEQRTRNTATRRGNAGTETITARGASYASARPCTGLIEPV